MSNAAVKRNHIFAFLFFPLYENTMPRGRGQNCFGVGLPTLGVGSTLECFGLFDQGIGLNLHGPELIASFYTEFK